MLLNHEWAITLKNYSDVLKVNFLLLSTSHSFFLLVTIDIFFEDRFYISNLIAVQSLCTLV